MQKRLHFSGLAVALLLCSNSFGQLFISTGATFNIQTGGIVTVQGDVTSSADITGAGKVILKGTGNQNVNMNGFTIPNLEMDNAANATLTGNARVGTDVTFTTGKIQQGNFNFVLASTATVTGAGSTKHFVTNGTGRLIKDALGATAFTYPVGSNTSTYNPVTISNSGTADNIGVICLSNVLSAGTTGAAFTKEVADASWDINEAVAGGSNLSLTTTWNASDEMSGFDRTKSGISYYIPTPGATQGWDLLNSQTSAAAGANPYTFTRTGISSLGAFAVGTRPVLSALLVSPKIFLQGPYNTGTGVMGDNLRNANLIPAINPYDSIPGFTASGSGGGETSTTAIVGSGAAAGNDAIVDWVFVQLHRASDSVVVSTRGALIQRDGDVVDTDGSSALNIAGNAAGSYFVSVRHRNHLGVRTTAPFALAKTSTTVYNFTTALTQAFSVGITNDAMATVNTGVFGMYGGNANVDRATRKTGSATINDYSLLLTGVDAAAAPGPTGVYRREDFNMDGNIRKTGSVLTNDYSKLLGILGSLNIISQPIF
jgi:hypothetical protein